MHQDLDYFKLQDHALGDVIVKCRLALEEYNKSTQSLDDMVDFCRCVDGSCYSIF